MLLANSQAWPMLHLLLYIKISNYHWKVNTLLNGYFFIRVLQELHESSSIICFLHAKELSKWYNPFLQLKYNDFQKINKGREN